MENRIVSWHVTLGRPRSGRHGRFCVNETSLRLKVAGKQMADLGGTVVRTAGFRETKMYTKYNFSARSLEVCRRAFRAE